MRGGEKTYQGNLLQLYGPREDAFESLQVQLFLLSRRHLDKEERSRGLL